ncbi:MAG: DNA methyltransferase [Candidatus Acidiferrales bacterium]
MVRHASEFAFDYKHKRLSQSLIVHADCLEWLGRVPENSIHGIVTDPPYGVKEYEFDQLEKRANGNGGIWRIPPAFDGSTRQPLPRFTALNQKERSQLTRFFTEWARVAVHALRPGGHAFIACNSFLCQMVYAALVEGGLEFRGQLIRVVRTFRGGDRPKNAEQEFPDVCSLPRGCYEPWGILRKPMPAGMRVSDCLREFETGGLRRLPGDLPFTDLIEAGRTPQEEREVAEHPSLKPQALLRELVYAVLPLGRGVVVDPFMGSGSTIAAAEAVGYASIGIEKDSAYYSVAVESIPALARFAPNGIAGKREEELATSKRSRTNSHREGGRLRRETDRRPHRSLFGASERI